MTLTKDQGGLGVKDLHSWNLACILKLIWMIFFRPTSVWVSWFKEVILRGDINNYWTINTSSSFSWLVNKMIKTRSQIYPLLRRRLVNGESTSFWVDNWSPFGNLYNYLGASTSRFGILRTATVASLYDHDHDHWLLPPARSENQLALHVYLTTVNLSDDQDQYEWDVAGKTSSRYSTGEVYTYLKGHVPLVPWTQLVWFSYGIPRHSFLTWLVMLNRCPTRDRLLQWGLDVDPKCLLCNNSNESQNHLFFDCSYSGFIWRMISDRCQLQLTTSWEDLIQQLLASPRNKDLRRLTLLAFQGSLYWLWPERNTRLHQQSFRTAESIFSTIDKQLRNCVQSFRHSNPRASSAMMQLWFLRS